MSPQDEMKNYRERYRLVNEFTLTEAGQTTPAERLRDLCIMYEAAHSLNTRDDDTIRQREETEVRQRWQRLKEFSGV